MGWKGFVAAILIVLSHSHSPRAMGQATHKWNSELHAIRIDAREMSGPGVAWLLERAKNSRFVMIGEQHGIEGPANLARHLLVALRPHDFDVLALEMGPWIANRIHEVGLKQAIRESPFAIAFDSDDDLMLMQASLSSSGDHPGRVIGIDQASNVIHLLQRLVEIAPDASAAGAARGLLLKAAIRGGEYSRQDHQGELERLSQRFGSPETGEAAEIFAAMRATNQIFLTYRQGLAGIVSPQVSAELREDYMVDRLRGFLAKAENSPRILFKMGGAHAMRGIGPNGIPTLGDHVATLAAETGEHSLSVSVRAWSAENTPLPETAFGDSTALLLDTLAFREQMTAEELSGVSETLQRDLVGFDAIIYVRNPSKLTFSEISVARSAFRRKIIGNLACLAIPFGILCIWMLATSIGALRKKAPKQLHEVSALRIRRIACATSLLPLSIIGFQFFVLWTTNSDSSWMLASGFWASGWLPVGIAGSAISLIGILIATLRQKISYSRRLGGFVICAAHLAILISMFYWNLGGMLASGTGSPVAQ